MIITHGNLLLKTVAVEDLEQLRVWRNSKEVNRYLVNRPFINAEAQQKWFYELNPSTSIYFVIIVDDKKAGIAYAHHIDIKEKSFEGSIFVGDIAFSDSFVSVKTALILTLFFFDSLGFASTYSTVHKDNFKALDLDRKLGYKEVRKNPPFIVSKCTKEDFLSTATPLIKVLLRGKNMQISKEPGDGKYSFIHNK